MQAKLRTAAGFCGIIIGILMLVAVNWEFLKRNSDLFLNITAITGILWGIFMVADDEGDDA